MLQIVFNEISAAEMAALAGRDCCLIEFGSGSSLKTEILLSHLQDLRAYVAIDVSQSALEDARMRLRDRFPRLRVECLAADFSHAELPADVHVGLRGLRLPAGREAVPGHHGHDQRLPLLPQDRQQLYFNRLDRLISDPEGQAQVPHIDYVREAGSEGIELVMWLIARGAMADVAGGPKPAVKHRFYHVPASNTAVGHLVLENKQ